MDLLILLVVIGIAIAFVVEPLAAPGEAARGRGAAEGQVAAEEDVVRFGEDVTLLGGETAGRQLDEATRQDYRRALDSYDAAKTALDQVQRPDDIRGITGILEDGRYAVACVQARLAGKPVPARLPRASSTPSTDPPARTSTGRLPVGFRARSRPARRTPSGSARALSRTCGRSRSGPAGPDWQGGRATAPTPRATSPRSRCPVCCPACSSARCSPAASAVAKRRTPTVTTAGVTAAVTVVTAAAAAAGRRRGR